MGIFASANNIIFCQKIFNIFKSLFEYFKSGKSSLKIEYAKEEII